MSRVYTNRICGINIESIFLLNITNFQQIISNLERVK